MTSKNSRGIEATAHPGAAPARGPARSPKSWQAPLVVAALLAAVALYIPSFHIKPYQDDAKNVINARVHGLNPFFRAGSSDITGATIHYFRPLERLAHGLDYRLFGERAGYLTTGLNLVSLLTSSLLLIVIARSWRPRDPATGPVAATIFLLHPGNVACVTQFAVLSQQLNVLFLLALLAWYTRAIGSHPLIYHGVGALLALLLTSSKETAMGGALIAPVVVGLIRRYKASDEPRVAFRHSIVALVVTSSALVLYLLVRAELGASFQITDVGRYTLTSSPAIIGKNVGLLLGGSAFLGSTLDLFVYRDLPRLAVSAVLSLGLAATTGIGLLSLMTRATRSTASTPGLQILHREEPFALAAITLMILGAMFPIAILTGVGERFLLLTTWEVALLMGIGLPVGWRRLSDGRGPRSWRGGILVVLAVACAGWGAWCVIQKVQVAALTSRIDAEYREQLIAWAATLSPGTLEGGICFEGGDLRQTTTNQRPYSVFSPPAAVLIRRDLIFVNALYHSRLTLVGKDSALCRHRFRLRNGQIVPFAGQPPPSRP